MKWRGILLLVLWVAVAPAQDSLDCKSEYSIHIRQGDFVKAKELLDSCFQQDSSVWALEKRGFVKTNLGETPAAKKDLLKLLELDDQNVFALSYLASIFESEEHVPKAIKYYRALTKLDSTNFLYHRKLGMLNRKGGLIISAMESYMLAHRLNPKDMKTMKAMVEILIDNKQYSEADQILDTAKLQDSTNISMILLSARNAYEQKDYKTTTLFLKKTNGKIDLSNYYTKMYGYALMQLDSIDQAIYYLEKALTGDRSSKEGAHYYLALAYDKKGQADFTKFHYEKAIQEAFSPNVGIYYKNLGLKLEAEKDYKGAIAMFKKAYEYKKEGIVLYYLARNTDIYYKDKSIAVKYYSRYIESNDKNEAYKNYAIERMKYLREVAHMNKN